MATLALSIPPLSKILRTAAVYLFIYAVQNAMVGPDVSFTGGVLAAVVLLIFNYAIARASLHFPIVRRLVEGTPTVLVLHGEIISRNLNRESLELDILGTAFREQGIAELSKVEMAVLEVDGSINVVPVGLNHKWVKNPAKFLRSK